MSPKSIRDTAIALLALVLALGAAYWLDLSVQRLRLEANQTFNFLPVLWLSMLAILGMATGLVTLIVWLATRASHPRLVDAVYLLTGLIGILFVPLAFTFQFGVPFPGFWVGGNESLWTFTTGLLAVCGALRLIWRPRLD